MAKTKQAAIKRKLAQAVNHCERAQQDLADVAGMYEKLHPDMAELLQVLCVSQDLNIQAIGDFCMMAWGKVPGDWDAWRNPNKRRPKVTNATPNG